MKRYPSLIIIFIVFILIILGYVSYTPLSIAGMNFQNLNLEGINVETRGQLGESCSIDGDCMSSYCSDSVCCDTACTGSTCQTCGALSPAGIGRCGFVSSSSQDPRDECSSTNCTDEPFLNSASGLSCDSVCTSTIHTTAYCSGSGYSCGANGTCSSCQGIGSTSSGQDSLYVANVGGSTPSCGTTSGDCSIDMLDIGFVCPDSGITIDYNYCYCQ